MYATYRKPDNIKYPCWLQPDRIYHGLAWYRRTVVLPEAWSGAWELHLERCHWSTRLWVNGEKLGFRESLCVEQVYEIPARFTGEVELTLCVDNRLFVDVGHNSHSVSDHTQTNWNGIIGKMEIHPLPETRLSALEIHPDPKTRSIRLEGSLTSPHPSENLEVTVTPTGTTTPLVSTHLAVSPGSAFSARLELGDTADLWSPEDPFLYELTLRTPEGLLLTEERFGLVDVETEATELRLNGRPLFLRGALDCAVFPRTGYPAMQVAAWKEIFQTCKAYGLNHIRFHSWCPPKAAFEAGDEVGILFQVECPSWANSTTSLGDGEPIDDWLYVEAERILKAYGNHACFRFMAYGNEPAGPNKEVPDYPGKVHGGAVYLAAWCTYWKEHDPRRIHTSGAGWPKITESDFHNVPEPRVQRWGEGLDSVINAKPPCSNYTFKDLIETDKPSVSHEIGQWCAFPDLEEIEHYTGILKAKNYEIFSDFLEQAGLRHQAKDFLQASGALQTFCYKADIEAALRTRGFAGYQLLGLQDFPGQGTALVGVLNAFWKSKGYCDAATFSEWCGDIVLLAEFEKHLYTSGESIKVPVLLTNFGSESLTGEQVHWCLQDETGDIHASGILTIPEEDRTGRTDLGTVTCDFPQGDGSMGYEFVLSLHEREIQNRWSVFSFPSPAPIPTGDLHITSTWSPETEQVLEQGGTVWLQLDPKTMKITVPFGFSSIFWNTAWSRQQPPHTLGILCDPDHPALENFPAGPTSDWQWWGVCRYGEVMILDDLPAAITPIIQIVPDWFAPHKLAVAFEARVGNGRLLVTSIDFTSAPEEDPARAQLARSFQTYITSEGFSPTIEVSGSTIAALTC